MDCYRAIKKNKQLIHLTTRINVKKRHKGAPTVRLHCYAIQYCVYSSAKSCATLCDPHGSQHASLPCPLLFPRVCSNSSPLSQWCYLTISFSVIPFSSCLQSFPASGSFPVLAKTIYNGGGGSGVVAKSCPTLVTPGSSVHGIFQARILEWVAISFSGGNLWIQESNPGLLHCRGFFTDWARSKTLIYN